MELKFFIDFLHMSPSVRFPVGPAAIRPLVCINKVTKQSGVCMFTMDCIAMNGTALGVCGDRFYFGSCCVVPALDEELNALERTGPTNKRRQQVSATHLLEMRDPEGRSLWPSSSEEMQDEENYWKRKIQNKEEKKKKKKVLRR